jgi:Family of unknown function (DUF6629)
MCFSATASFTSAALIGGVGIASLKKAKSRSLLLLTLIPFLFALQQASEGVVWLSMEGIVAYIPYGDTAKSIFLLFAFTIWPIWIPLSFYLAEEEKTRKGLLLLVLAAGLILAVFNLFKGAPQNIDVMQLDRSLRYLGELPDESYLYIPIVVLPAFITSLRRAWLFGLLILVAAIGVDYLYEKVFVSVWCFLAAIISLSLYAIVCSTAKGSRAP